MRDENLPHGEAFWIASIKQVTKVQDKSQVSVEVKLTLGSRIRRWMACMNSVVFACR